MMEAGRDLVPPERGQGADTSGQPPGQDPLTISCPAKINLTLEVLGRYADGYHRIASIMQAISLADVLTITPAPDLTFDCDQPGLAGPENLVLRAAMLLKETTGYHRGAHLLLKKAIPEAAGLGGGSSDAAAALKGLNTMWNLNLTRQQLVELGARLGADVPFFIYGGTALAQGRGERLRPAPEPGILWLVLLCPPVSLAEKTRTLYRSLTPGHYTQGEHTEAMMKTLKERTPLSDSLLFNVFERVAPSVFPGLTDFTERLLRAGATGVHLAGSGPTIFAIFQSRAEAESVLRGLSGLEYHLAYTISARP